MNSCDRLLNIQFNLVLVTVIIGTTAFMVAGKTLAQPVAVWVGGPRGVGQWELNENWLTPPPGPGDVAQFIINENAHVYTISPQTIFILLVGPNGPSPITQTTRVVLDPTDTDTFTATRQIILGDTAGNSTGDLTITGSLVEVTDGEIILTEGSILRLVGNTQVDVNAVEYTGALVLGFYDDTLVSPDPTLVSRLEVVDNAIVNAEIISSVFGRYCVLIDENALVNCDFFGSSPEANGSNSIKVNGGMLSVGQEMTIRTRDTTSIHVGDGGTIFAELFGIGPQIGSGWSGPDFVQIDSNGLLGSGLGGSIFASTAVTVESGGSLVSAGQMEFQDGTIVCSNGMVSAGLLAIINTATFEQTDGQVTAPLLTLFDGGSYESRAGIVNVGTLLFDGVGGSFVLDGGHLIAATVDMTGPGTDSSDFSMTSGTLTVDAFNGNLVTDNGCLSPLSDTACPLTIATHSGSTDPAIAGWNASPGSGGGVTTGPINDGGTDAWFVDDDSTASASTFVYQRIPSATEIAEGNTYGWTLSTTLRVASDEEMMFEGSPAVEYRDGNTSWSLHFGLTDSGDTFVRLMTALETGPIHITTGNSAYHSYQLVYDPSEGSADLFVDGVEVLSDYEGAATTQTRLFWGAGRSPDRGRANFAAVDLSVNPPTNVIHTGDSDPTTEGWIASPGSGGGVTVGPIDDGGTNAWFVDDDSTASASTFVYQYFPTEQEVNDGNANGWKLSTILRVVSDEEMRFEGSPAVAYRDGSTSWSMDFGLTETGDTYVRLVTGLKTGPAHIVSGNSTYHKYELRYDSDNASADLFVDDVEVLSDYVGQATTQTRVFWGAGRSPDRGQANFAEVSFSLITDDSTGVTTIDGDWNFNSGSLAIELGGSFDGGGDKSQSEFDWIDVTGDVTLAGNLDVQLVNGYQIPQNESFEIMNIAGALTGTFAGLDEGDLVGVFGGVELFISYVGGDGNNIVLFSSEQILLGDANLDGVVNLLDVQPFIELISMSGFQSEADCNQDGVVNLLDVEPFIAILSGS